MTWELVLAFNLALFAAILSPGPAMLIAIRTSLVYGRRSGILAGVGLAITAVFWTTMALFGLDSIFKLFPWIYLTVKTLGAAYLVYIAWKIWKGSREPIELKGHAKSRPFIDAVLVNLLNPKSILFAAAMLAVIFPPDLTLAEKAFIALNHLVVELICYTVFALALSTKAVSRKYLEAKTWLDRFAAIVLGALGLRLLVGR